MEEKATHPISVIVTDDQSHTLFSEQFKATYHSVRGAVSESKHVFIENGLDYFNQQFLPYHVSVLEIGFGTGLNAFLTYIYAKENELNINYHTVEAYPVAVIETSKFNYTDNFLAQDKIVFQKMHQQEWNREGELSNSFSFTKYLCLLENFKTESTFDVIYFDAFSPSEQPELWTEIIFKKLFDLLNPNGVLVTYCAQGQMKRNMKNAGFIVQSLPGALGKREMTRGLKKS